jgi:hypothetical protein
MYEYYFWSKLMSVIVYTDKHVCKYIRLNRWMDARLYVRNFVCVMNACVWRYVCIYVEKRTVFMCIWLYVWECTCVINVCMFLMYICLCMFLHTHVCMYVCVCMCARLRVFMCACACVCVCVCLCVQSPVSQLHTDQFGVPLTLETLVRRHLDRISS